MSSFEKIECLFRFHVSLQQRYIVNMKDACVYVQMLTGSRIEEPRFAGSARGAARRKQKARCVPSRHWALVQHSEGNVIGRGRKSSEETTKDKEGQKENLTREEYR